MYPQRRRRGLPDPRDEATDRGGAPVYRRDDKAVEYETEKHGRKEEPREGQPEPPAGRTAKGGFHPLPRCPSCKAAIGFEQRECHSCGRELKKV